MYNILTITISLTETPTIYKMSTDNTYWNNLAPLLDHCECIFKCCDIKCSKSHNFNPTCSNLVCKLGFTNH